MSTVTNSATQSAVQLFGTISTTANALSTAVGVVGNGFDVLAVHSKDWLNDARIKSAAMAEEREMAVIDDITFSIATRLAERAKLLQQNPDLATSYAATVDRVTKAVQAAKVRHNINGATAQSQAPATAQAKA